MIGFMLVLFGLVQVAPKRILELDTARLQTGVPDGWKVREVRGRGVPHVEIRDDGEGPVLRMSGAGRAAWFYRELAPALPESSGVLQWSWRVLASPDSADMRVEALDDAPVRVYAVFGRQRAFRRSPRVVFYSFGNREPDGFMRPSFGTDNVQVIRVDGAGDRGRWRDHVADPFADYRRIWRESPPPISAIGLMQDTDQTLGRAIAEVRQLEWAARGR